MAENDVKFLWQGGKLIPIEDAKVHILTPTVFWGTNVFEGLRGYWNPEHQQMYCFRQQEHFDRLGESVKMMRMSMPFEPDRYGEYVKEVIVGNEVQQDIHFDIRVYLDGIGRWYDTEPSNMFIAIFPIGRAMSPVISVHGEGYRIAQYLPGSRLAPIIKTADLLYLKRYLMDMNLH